mmetsp:Transcript_11700/g.23535  ORF Transcript_11700/g.23535 Transcript_11700/m.23535 type:complete len:102 (+) Transcript_11700:1033-1338(+)
MRIAIRRLFHGSFAQLLHHAGGDLHHPVGGQEEQEDVDDRIHVPLEHGDGLKRLRGIAKTQSKKTHTHVYVNNAPTEKANKQTNKAKHKKTFAISYYCALS